MVSLKKVGPIPDRIERQACVTSSIVRESQQNVCAKFSLSLIERTDYVEIHFVRISDFPVAFHLWSFLRVEFFKEQNRLSGYVLKDLPYSIKVPQPEIPVVADRTDTQEPSSSGK